MGHGRGQPDRLPLARPLARSLAHARGTGHPPGGKGTRYESHARGPTPGPASTRLAPPPHPTPPPPAQAGGRRRGWEAEGNTDGRRHGEARAGGHGDGRAGRGAAGKGAQRRPGRETPPAGGNARAAARRTGAGGGGRQAREQREEKPGGRPPTARGPPCLPLSPSTQPHARVRPRRPTTDGWLEAGRPTPWSDTKTPRARGHEAPRGHSPGGSARRRKDTAASRGPPPGHASPGRGHARDTASGRAARPDRARRCLGGARGAEGTPGGAADRGREPAGHRRHRRRRRVGGARQTGGGGGPDSTPRPISRGLPAARRGDSARRPHPTPGETHHAQKTACGARRLPKGRRRPRPTASARALWSVSSLSRAARAPPRPRSRRRPPPANPPHRPTRAPSSERAAGAGRGGGVGCGADTAGGRGGAPVSALRGTKGTRRPCEDTPAAPPPERETPRGWRLIVKRRSDRRSPGRNPGPQVRSKCR